jgi:hypothetical protein
MCNQRGQHYLLQGRKEPMPDESAPVKPSAVEVFKTDSDYLKGDIPEELHDGEAGFG